ncbi:uncharacterized protein BHQ10_009248 [Talaromyces amestolkiae]|uniref:F-box domain-containing protein n=1 Tax=Talaromyces amestolkiae TaxID=1196081 RepID=A0A364LBP2_TALAM|nr:uncharacterized protein BHQ10_009248 [Talaromyces amestolkiae]RAO73236.1 hypothetical protein BHQ10_009248 [Talaromyces amestolkiae]
MLFMNLPVDVILCIADFLSYADLASLNRTNQNLAYLLTPFLYNSILKSEQAPTDPYYGLPWPVWINCIGKWRSPLLLNYFEETPMSNLAYTGLYRATLIHLAAQQDNCDLVEILISRGFAPDEKDYFGKTPLHYALNNQKEQMANYLLDLGADVMAKKGYSLLLAAEGCSPEMVERIVEKMEALEARFKPFEFTGFPTDNTVRTIKDLSLNAAKIRRSTEIAELLIRYGADPEWASNSQAVSIFAAYMDQLEEPFVPEF